MMYVGYRPVLALGLLCYFCWTPLIAQVQVSVFPTDYQLYPRDKATNEAQVQVAGQVSSPIDALRLLVERDGSVYLDTTFTVLQAAPDSFHLSAAIHAELQNYRFTLYHVDTLNETQTLVAEADEVVAGDAFIVHGQSNAEAGFYQGSAAPEYDAFARVFGSANPDPTVSAVANPTWGIGVPDGNHTQAHSLGQWPAAMAKRLIQALGIPIAIFNAADPGKRITFFQRDTLAPDNLNTNYGRLLDRIEQAGWRSHLRTLLWYQGESDALDGRSTNFYLDEFSQLYRAWQEDYSQLDRIYLIQIRLACSGMDVVESLAIQEAQRLLARDSLNTPLMNAKGVAQHSDACHFPYSSYREIGLRMAALLLQDRYQIPQSPGATAPRPAIAQWESPYQLRLETASPSDQLTWQPGVEQLFLVSDSIEADSGWADGHQLWLTFDQPLGGSGQSLSHYDLRGSGVDSPYVINQRGIGLTSFWRLPIEDAPTVFPVELGEVSLKQSEGQILLWWETYAEQNSHSFTVERAAGQSGFRSIAQVAAQGYSEWRHAYEVIDRDWPTHQPLTYRLWQTDLDGSRRLLHQAAIVPTPPRSHRLRAYVLTDQQAVILTYAHAQPGLISLEVLDAQGRQVWAKPIHPSSPTLSLSINTASWSPGLYQARLHQAGRWLHARFLLP